MKSNQIARWKYTNELYDHISIELIPQPGRRGPRATITVAGNAIELADLHELMELRRLLNDAGKVGRRFAGPRWFHRRERKLTLLRSIGVAEVDPLDMYARHEGSDEEDEF